MVTRRRTQVKKGNTKISTSYHVTFFILIKTKSVLIGNYNNGGLDLIDFTSFKTNSIKPYFSLGLHLSSCVYTVFPTGAIIVLGFLIVSHFYKQATLTGAPLLSSPALIGTTKLPSPLLEPAVNPPRYRQTFVFSREREVSGAQGREPRRRLC